MSAATINHILQRHALTHTSHRLCIVLVGLPGRGKSFLSRKLQQFLLWRGCSVKIVNVGKYRRQEGADGGGRADFFAAGNKAGADERARVAGLAVQDMLAFLDEPIAMHGSGLNATFEDKIAIFDATNSTNERREWLLGMLKNRPNPIAVVFVESICDDAELLEDNFREKISLSPDFEGMAPEDALSDLKERVRQYELQYETIEDDTLSYIKIYNLSAKILANQIYGRMSKSIIPCLMAWNIGARPIWLCRAGETTNESSRSHGTLSTSAKLNANGHAFRSKLEAFTKEKTEQFWKEQIGGHALASRRNVGVISESGTSDRTKLGVKIMTSTMPRAIETACFSSDDYKFEQYSHLNPLDKGDYSGMEMDEIEVKDPEWYEKLKADPYQTRFPGGESYHDLIQRLESTVIEMEQQISPVLVVSHVSVLQCMLSYFRGSSVRSCASIAFPMDTVVEMTPVMGGGWKETRYVLCEAPALTRENLDRDALRRSCSDAALNTAGDEHPIWGDAPRGMDGVYQQGRRSRSNSVASDPQSPPSSPPRAKSVEK
jgi:broad specificity phosphatase PhoE